MDEYEAFLARKALVVPAAGMTVDPATLHPALKDFQRASVAWALHKGRAALFESTGLGKTFQQLVWAEHAATRALIVAPLAVVQQTVREGIRWGIPVTYARSQQQAAPTGITITNYDMAPHFDAAQFDAVVLDESSALKDETAKRRGQLIVQFGATPMRLCCTATPAPNDIDELGNHAEFLGVMTLAEMRAAFFVHDENGYHLKGHAQQAFYRWLASWAMSMIRPSDLGFDNTGYDLPPLSIVPEIIRTNYLPRGRLVPVGLKGIQDRAAVRKDTLHDRVARAATLINADPTEPWIAWVGLNDEGRQLQRLVPDAVLVEGSQSPDVKADALFRFANGETRVLITKGKIAGLGLNLQVCARMVFVGLSDSYEQYFQCIRRCHRFAQTRPVRVHIVLSELEETIYHNVLRKEQEATEVMQQLVQQAAIFEREELGLTNTAKDTYTPAQPMRLPAWLRTVAA
jgi:hypothetical protein